MRQTTSSSNGEEGYKGMAAPAHVLVKHVAVGKRRYQDILTPQSESMSITRYVRRMYCIILNLSYTVVCVLMLQTEATTRALARLEGLHRQL